MSTAMKKLGRPKKILTDIELKQRKDKIKKQKQDYERRCKDSRNQKRRNFAIQNDDDNSVQSTKRTTTYLGNLNDVEKFTYEDIGDMMIECEKCKGLSFKNEQGRSKNSCCHGGKIVLHELKRYPEDLENLLLGDDERSKHYRQNIRVYNNAFAFASFNAKSADISGRGPYCMRIIGEPYKKATTSLYSEKKPRYGQIYIYDDNETVNYRLDGKMNRDLLLHLQSILKNNPYAESFRYLHEVFEEKGDESVSLNFVSFSSDDQRRYNVPTTNAVAAVINTCDGSIPYSVDVKVYPKNEKDCDFLSNLSQHSDPMLFPLLFPNGDNGWSYLMKTENSKNISPLQYYSYRLTPRSGKTNHLLCSGRLTQQYIINCFLTIEAQRLKFLRHNQDQIRSEFYQGLVDHVSNSVANNADNVRIGNVMILPSTYQGSARAMQQLYQDAMAISRKIGRPDLFITMTCNPKWPEITRYLKTLPPGLTANDIPHFTCRLFYQKVISLIKDLHIVFGPIRAYVYTIEFQKRGLPHMHLLVTLQNKLLTADDIDKYISAEIPDKAQFPKLWYKVVKHMLHGPHEAGLPCYDKETNKCSKHFPKEYIENTDMTGTGFPKYKRRNNIHQMNTYHGKHNGKIIMVDNSMVVPYNSYLLMTYDCHINVEYCRSIMSIKYIHKYIHKGHDRAKIQVQNQNISSHVNISNEIQDYIDCRYLSASESAWRIFELPLHGRSHPVERLPVHLPGMNRILFKEGKESVAINNNCNTKLTAYFELNEYDAEARCMKYEDIPLNYRWINNTKKWQKRKYCTTLVTRIMSISSKATELFHLKLLLRNVKGAKSFNELKTVGNLHFDTFREAAVALGLVVSDTEMVEVLNEACDTLLPHQLRHFYVYMLIGCENINGKELWVQFKSKLSEGITEIEALMHINDMLEKENYSITDFGIQKPDTVANVVVEIVDYEYHDARFKSMFQLLNNEQKHAFDTICASLNGSSKQNCFYIDGIGGSGKTFLYRCLIHLAIVMRKKIFTIAWTGIAAILLPYGRTAHKSFQLPFGLNEKSTLFWSNKTKKILMDIDIFIWDEASMIPVAALESIDIALRDICSSNESFGGKIMLLGGDFRQVLPVVKRAGKSQIINSTIKSSYLWNTFECMTLTKNMRAANESSHFSSWLLSIGNGEIENVIVSDEHYCSDIVEEMYRSSTIDNYTTQAILTPRNEDVNVLNNKIINLLPGDLHEIQGIDYVTSRGTDWTDEMTELSYPLEYVNSLTPSGFPPHKLNLKIGVIIMLIRNLSISDGLCNGTRLIVKGIKTRILSCEILTGDKKGKHVFIPRIKLDSSADTELPFILHRTQFPIRLAFAMTINKSQGQTFERVGIYLMDNHPIFTHGQLYVALSRCKTFNGIKIQLSKENKKKQIRNIVFSEILQK